MRSVSSSIKENEKEHSPSMAETLSAKIATCNNKLGQSSFTHEDWASDLKSVDCNIFSWTTASRESTKTRVSSH